MSDEVKSKLPEILEEHRDSLLEQWIEKQLSTPKLRPDLMKDAEIREQSENFINLLQEAVVGNNLEDIERPNWTPVRDVLRDISHSRAQHGFSPSETAKFVYSLKELLFVHLREKHDEKGELTDDYWTVTVLLDQLGLYATEVFQQEREAVIRRQQEEMFELSAPVVELWDGILALPLIGTLDSRRTQIVMEALLNEIAASQAEIAIIDITGVPAVDTLTAQHLQKTVTAARLMGADCLISGVRPQIAQTMVSVGLNFGEVITKPTMSGALAVALKLRGLLVQPLDQSNHPGE
jgi:rsbT co-antagonist protein RsbR